MQGTLTRANTICQIERFRMSKAELQDPLNFPRYLHVLQPVMGGQDETAEWAGRMREMRLMMKANAQSRNPTVRRDGIRSGFPCMSSAWSCATSAASCRSDRS